MPNHVTNMVVIKGDPIKIKEVMDNYTYNGSNGGDQFYPEERALDFTKIKPMPPELEAAYGYSAYDFGLWAYFANDLSLAERFNIYYMDNEDINKILQLNKALFYPDTIEDIKRPGSLFYPTSILDSDFDDPINYNRIRKLLQNGVIMAKNIMTYGYPTGYEWACEEWGTKWNAYFAYNLPDEVFYTEHYDDTLVFNTAWSSCSNVVEVLSNMYPDLIFELYYFDELMAINSGIIIFHNGTKIEQYPADTSEGEETIRFVNFITEKILGYKMFYLSDEDGNLIDPDEESIMM